MAKQKQKDTNIEFPEQKIVPINMEKEVKKSFIEYSMSVIVSRALPDARDGMKPGQRRVLYAMWEDNLTFDKAYRKSATTVGNVLFLSRPECVPGHWMRLWDKSTLLGKINYYIGQLRRTRLVPLFFMDLPAPVKPRWQK